MLRSAIHLGAVAKRVATTKIANIEAQSRSTPSCALCTDVCTVDTFLCVSWAVHPGDVAPRLPRWLLRGMELLDYALSIMAMGVCRVGRGLSTFLRRLTSHSFEGSCQEDIVTVFTSNCYFSWVMATWP